MKYYTEKQFRQDCEVILEHTKGNETIYYHRTVWKLATENWKLKRVSYERIEKAQKIYKSIRKMWRYKDLNMEYDSTCTKWGEKKSKEYSNKEDKVANNIKPILKELNLRLTFSTYAHVEDRNGCQII